MAHDRQIAVSSNDTNVVRPPSKTFSDIVADWLIVYAKVYREEVTEELTLAYSETLKDLRLELLHQAFLRAMKLSKFRPTPAEVRESFDVLAEQLMGNRPAYLDEPPMSERERNEALAEPQYQDLRQKLLIGVGHHARCLCRDCRKRREQTA